MSEQEYLFDFDYIPNWNSYEFDLDCQDYERQQIDRIKEKCNMNLLKRQLVCLFGFPSIQIDSGQIIAYLNGIMDLNENEQKRMIRVLISFIGEVTSIEDPETRLETIRTRVEQFLTIKGIKIEWSNKVWEYEIESLFESRYCNPYYSKIPYTQFEYANFFALLESPMPMFLRSLNHPCCCQVYDAKSTEDFKQLCNITDLKNVRRIRKYIQSIIDKLEEFRNLLIDIETKNYKSGTDVINSFNQLSQELDKIINIDLQLSDKCSLKQEERLRFNNDADNQTEKNSIALLETKTSANTFTTIHQGNLDCRTKRQKKKQKQLEKCYFSSAFLNYIDSETNLSLENSQNSEPKLEDQLFKFTLNTEIHNQLNIQCTSVQDILKKIEIYQNQLQSLQLIGFPCPKLDKSHLKYILSNFRECYTNKKILIEWIISIIWESLTIKEDENNCINEVRKQALEYFSSIKLDREEFEYILNNCYEKQASMPYNKSFEIAPFSIQKLSQLVNRKFPESFQLNNCLASRVVFKSKVFQPLEQPCKITEIKNIRTIRKYINDIYQSLEKLVEFKNKLNKTNSSKSQNHLLIREFKILDSNHQDKVNRKLKQKDCSSLQKIDKEQSEKNCIIIDDKDQLDRYFNCQDKNAIEIEDDPLIKKEELVKSKQNQIQNDLNFVKKKSDINLKLEAKIEVEQAKLEYQKEEQFLCNEMISPVQRYYFHENQSPNIFHSPCFNYCSPLAKQFFNNFEFDQQEIESPDRQFLQFQPPHNFN
ncbi:unnamed protein product [Paramecium pentaurelia]|uniref:Uncharacterized protein n=1 Tax=Paramecium pentaurelia TaxID=43138 RepID=A0A8S1T3L4_9CILI|nr:unnamed protein product [Paramecium pentaurelia]